MLLILSGHSRYAHVSAMRTDGVNPGLLGMSGWWPRIRCVDR